jgi:hypothetical protein
MFSEERIDEKGILEILFFLKMRNFRNGNTVSI